MVIAHEADVLSMIEPDVLSRNQIFSFLLNNSQEFSKRGRAWSGYNYEIEGQWQGRFKTLEVIGDKKGGKGTKRIIDDPTLLKRLKDTVGMNVKIIHHIRNPYDIITTICRRKGLKDPSNEDINYFFSLCDCIENVKRQEDKNNFFEGRHEDFIVDPKDYLLRLCQFLNLEATDDYLESCAAIVEKSPHKSRNLLPWSDEKIEAVSRGIDRFDFLKGYSLNN